MKDDPLIGVVGYLAWIEAKLDSHGQLREKAGITFSMTKNNEGDIVEIKESQKWT